MVLFFNRLWYAAHHPLAWVLRPFSWVFQFIVTLRRFVLQAFQSRFPIPIIVVGNLTVGGVGKTPLVIELAKKCQEKGLRVGIVSRGYKAKRTSFPYEVKKNDSAKEVGDEPLLLALKTNCPVVIDPKRSRGVRYLLKQHPCQVIISDDGLQHYQLGRAIEILVIDGVRGFGNGLCLPAGPLREPKKRLKTVDFLIVNEHLSPSGTNIKQELRSLYPSSALRATSPHALNEGKKEEVLWEGAWDNAFSMNLKPGKMVHLRTKEEVALNIFNREVAAVSAIGHPERFYSTLNQLGINYKAYSYPDHYQFSANDLNYLQSVIIMTEKDAVKCFSFNSDKIYYLPVDAVLNDAFWDAFWSHKQLQGYC